ncbi:MAG: UDP-glucose/GDP-mannose dehydrogenase family protein [Deltaproteobacteria bacterium]|nr:MAG: UDP-glucose/GDP-mannose dehydrogenase family protein [Deltaproteobacteria bacterium]
MQICMMGSGYVGLVTGACLAEFGMEVMCADKDRAKIEMLQRGQIPFYEPGLEDLVEKNTEEGRLSFTTDIQKAVEICKVIFIAVGTPANSDGSPDLSQVEAAAREVARYMDKHKIIVLKSTVPVGTGRWIKRVIGEEMSGAVPFDLVSNPEFLREGSAIEDFMRPDRVVIGAEAEGAIEVMKQIYSARYLIETPFVITTIETAEVIKYASNAFLATKISFINEIANLCEQVGADVHDVARAMGLDGRIGRKFLHPGPGFGGSCFPKDTEALIHTGRDYNCEMEIVKSTVKVNKKQRERMIEKIGEMVGDLQGKTVGILGLAFKPNTDDMREAPSITIIKGLQAKGVRIKAYDPAAMEEAKKILNDVVYCKGPYEVAEGSHALVLITEWNRFRRLDLERIKGLLQEPIFIDLRNVYEPHHMRALGFKYCGVGR